MGFPAFDEYASACAGGPSEFTRGVEANVARNRHYAAALAGRVVQLCFTMRDAALYSVGIRLRAAGVSEEGVPRRSPRAGSRLEPSEQAVRESEKRPR